MCRCAASTVDLEECLEVKSTNFLCSVSIFLSCQTDPSSMFNDNIPGSAADKFAWLRISLKFVNQYNSAIVERPCFPLLFCSRFCDPCTCPLGSHFWVTET